MSYILHGHVFILFSTVLVTRCTVSSVPMEPIKIQREPAVVLCVRLEIPV